jgi:hypothetical protein
MALRKSNTFNARTGISSELCSPVDHARYMPKRSPTSTKSLEDILPKEDTHQQDVAKLLQQFDDKINGRLPVGGDGSILKEEDVLAIPSFMIAQVNVAEPMDIDVKQAIVEHHHDSDSGLGSSVASTTIGTIVPGHNRSDRNTLLAATDICVEHNSRRSTRSSNKSFSSSHSTITKSASSLGNASQYVLSADAVRHIKKHIVQPILKEGSLKEFHPLVEDVPRRIGARFISNLRDLEKTLFFLAPVSPDLYDSARAVAHALRDLKEYSSSPRSFLKFCETTIQCLHTTVDYLCQRDQRLPTDRPYTNNYFLDLVEQIRRYAEIMARTREKEAAGEPLDEMDYSPYVIPVHSLTLTPFGALNCDSRRSLSHNSTLIGPFPFVTSHMSSNLYLLLTPYSDEEVTIAGGLSNNGKPAELVRKKNGKVIPISEHSTINAGDEVPSAIKRPLSEDEMDDDDIHRSMARRRKSDRPGDVMHPCAVCDKEFKRPCDLTKHEKTHSRPWKCPDAKCRYHEHGWPTEKERDRHVNDKHSARPRMYPCEFPPCTYSSKRESNCKQHMEKAHGWQYVRSKSNGRNKTTASSSSGNRTASEPLTPFIATPASVTHNNFSSPESPFLASPSMQPDSVGFGGFGDYSRFTPGPSAEDLFAYDTRRESVTTAGSGLTYSSGYSPHDLPGSAFEEALTPEDIQYNHSAFDNSPMTFNFGAAPFQQPTPAMSVNQYDVTETLNFSGTVAGPSGTQHLSPIGQADLTLFSPHTADNLHFDEALGGAGMDFNSDFTLFDTAPNTSMANVAASNWFPSVDMNFGNVGSQFDSNFNLPTDAFEDAFNH